MTDLNKDGIDDELASYKSESVNAKFGQQLSYGIGAAMVFGLVSVLGHTLATAAGAAITEAGATTVTAMVAAAAGPIIGLTALGVIGVGLLYLSAKFLSENTMRDQQLQARQISVATRAHAPVIAPTIDTKPKEFPDLAEVPAAAAPKIEASALTPVPTTQIGERVLADTVTPRVESKGTKVTGDADAAWVDQMARDAQHVGQIARA